MSFVARCGAALTVAVAVLVGGGYKEMGGSMMFRRWGRLREGYQSSIMDVGGGNKEW